MVVRLLKTLNISINVGFCITEVLTDTALSICNDTTSRTMHKEEVSDQQRKRNKSKFTLNNGPLNDIILEKSKMKTPFKEQYMLPIFDDCSSAITEDAKICQSHMTTC